MKEATGELNLSVIVISSVAILAAFFYTVLWQMINHNQQSQVNCSKAICNKPTDEDLTPEYVTCHMPGDDDETFECKYKG